MGMPKYHEPGVQYELLDDFLYLDTQKWQSIDDGGTGTNTANNVAGGQVSIVTTASDNDYHVMASMAKSFQFANGKPAWFEAEFSLTEANTDDANIVLGFCSTTSGGILVANGAGLPSTFDGALFYKVDGGTSWNFGVSAGSTQELVAGLAPFVSGTTYRLGFHFTPSGGATGRITPWAYSVAGGGTPTDVIDRRNFLNSLAGTYEIALSGLGAMYAVYGVKAGGANAETLKMNQLRAIGTR